MNISELIAAYKAHRYSPYRKLTFTGQKHCDYSLKRIEADWGARRLSDIKAVTLIVQYDRWSSEGLHIDIAYNLVKMLRRLFGFGFTFLEDKHCDRLCRIMAGLEFKRSPPREQRLTADHAIAARAEAHRIGLPSMALGIAILYDFGWRPKDAFGGYEPRERPGESDIVSARLGKWLHGLLWPEIDDRLVVHHRTAKSRRKKKSQPPILYAPMVMAELKHAYPGCITEQTIIDPATAKVTVHLVPHRDRLPVSGAVIVNERTGWPYTDQQFRREWRRIATAAGIPKDVQLRDARAGAITHALGKGVPMERVRQMAGHSSSKITALYARDPGGETAAAMKQRVE